MGDFDNFKVDLSTVVRDMPPLEPMGLAYRGRIAWIAGPPGSAKTGICRGIVLADLRRGIEVGWIDYEMTASEHRAYFEALGATPEELKQIHFWSYPVLTSKEEATKYAKEIAAYGPRTVVLDKWTDFVAALGGADNSTDDANNVARAFLQPLVENSVTSYIIDATGHGTPGQVARARGAFEKIFKIATSWVTSVEGPSPKKDRIGLIHLRNNKDRGGDIGDGTVVKFEYGGDGNGGIVFSMLGVADTNSQQPGDAGAVASEESMFDDLMLRAFRSIAPDATKAQWQNDAFKWVYANGPDGTHDRSRLIVALKRIALTRDAEMQDHVVAVSQGMNGGNETFKYYFEAATGFEQETKEASNDGQS